MQKQKGPWRWDTFPKQMTVLWWVFMVVLLVVTALWRDRTSAWAVTHVATVIMAFAGMALLVGVGNYIPGIPNMFLPLITGWALVAGLPIPIGIGLIFITWTVAIIGSSEVRRRAHREGNNLLRRWKLDKSERYAAAVTAVRTVPNVILKSRVGKFAAYCGHVNIAAGVEGYDIESFYQQMVWGHFFWTLQYVALGFLISWLMPYVGKLFL